MSTLADRLRGIVAAIPASRPQAQAPQRDHGPADDVEAPRAFEAAADILDGEWVTAAGGRVLVVDRLYRAGYRHGQATLMDSVLPDVGEWCRPYLGGAELWADGTDLRSWIEWCPLLP